MSEIKLVIGDSGGDGHDHTATFIIESNLSLHGLRNAYEIGSSKLGFDFMSCVADEYEDSTISKKFLTKLEEFGYEHPLSDHRSEDKKHLSWDDYIDISMFICKLGDKSFEYKIVDDKFPTWEIGGYGLFH